jgi:ABC-type microcin C transport system duplicated ATPase subunit YejF
MYVREQMLEYVKKVPQCTRMAVLGLSNRLYILRGLTTDPAVLKADVQMFRAKKVSLPVALRGPYTRSAIQDLVKPARTQEPHLVRRGIFRTHRAGP